jgi:hypothetical protein
MGQLKLKANHEDAFRKLSAEMTAQAKREDQLNHSDIEILLIRPLQDIPSEVSEDRSATETGRSL